MTYLLTVQPQFYQRLQILIFSYVFSIRLYGNVAEWQVLWTSEVMVDCSNPGDRSFMFFAVGVISDQKKNQDCGRHV